MKNAMGPRTPTATKTAREAFSTATDDRVHLTVRIPASLRQELKIYAVEHDISVTHAVTSAVEELLRSNTAHREIRPH